MAEIKVAKSAGFCFGVDRAVKLVYGELEKGNKSVATLGPIIHNADVVNDLTDKGVRIADSVDDLKEGEKAVIRSHGVGKKIYEGLDQKGNAYIDATCPFVARIHKIVREKTEEGYFILIAGDKDHPEVQGIVGHCDENYYVFKDEDQLKSFFSKNYKNLEKKLAIVAQTTYNILIWGECLKVIPKDDENILVFDTICNATSQRQSDAALLSKEVDVMIVVGGKNSSNTIKLYNVCSENCPSYHIENADELYSLNLKNAEKIGITAGASTPAYIIKEVQNTMAEILEDDINFEEALEQSFKKVHTGERVKGYIAAVNNSEAIVDIGTKHTGYVPLSELTDDQTKKPSDIVSVGEEVDLIVTKINDQEGIVTLSKKKVDELVGFDNISKAKEEDAVLDGVVLNVVKGGILVSVDGVRVFVPASQTGLGRDKNLDELLKQKVQIKIIEVNESRRRAVGSIKAVAKAQREAAKAAFWETAEIGKVYKGEVKSLTNYGAFVDLGGIDGMVHISELSWGRIKHPSQVVKVGDILEVYIKELDKESGRISLGFKKAEDNPWVKFQNNYNVGDVVKATIVSITPFGAFAQIIEGVDGLIHISQIADKRVDNVNDVLSVGQEVDVKITEIDLDKKRISISIRALLDDAAAEETEDAE
ncbi:bifunctional 4-hydroxy-3-methylbut-2-enyl diphosphate reductase/30S ribosomal protein S1 [Porcipelethomonas ammoniilytica]|jgi:4-hydroxy-3-methylbut-2-enyl diphosphate reductase|uniref:bifunctional 4-hydroxy-3-methylbut-2-enyl diphosphate reductase/30S ribosomal protein S1 n=1 Tax=Porcipelethomonas TaxID=2981643 RepID=UPI000821AA2F|nr:bifunctional 4-hydroxy-3-methylbut-2-enyl diphosphate reductase/30S ribosomal protein S1 [Porcipelethomonas ammoniilytica]MCU6718804.1 bifunctional 4-hydroxy-3-methylbut-2-enyl diphosphate reductase/30S ribosomal protein S1 [Porcipelethomonas ammoniilytica]MEE0186471.1 bifunctional 4-hydroxy-3-methylbut-2-enyl diphosphate reductase/30S ribosomal protein S1 [Oscillospiraceae bacterium]SCI61017.1 4-hydroxy-3-methylbut-2-enyl diphosphate reductase [uncultured Ruminococcus sp.]